MLIINNSYTPLKTVLNESEKSDDFEKKCYDYLKATYSDRDFKLFGSNNNTVSDILVDDSFYIECKMSDASMGNGAQATGFTLALTEDENGNNKFICSKQSYVKSKVTDKIINYINKNIDEFIELINPNSGTRNILLDKDVFAKCISDYYNGINVKFFMTSKDEKFIIFENTPKKLLYYFDISACARFFGYGTKDLPKGIRDDVIKFLNSKYEVTSVKYDDNITLIKIKDQLSSRYIKYKDTTIFLSSKYNGLSKGEYRVMKSKGKGAPRVMFKLKTINDQSPSDLELFENSKV